MRAAVRLPLLALLLAAPAAAAPRPARIFGDHLVLQCEVPVPVWGDAAPGEAVTVEFAGRQATATADAAGHWRVTLAALPASAAPRDLVVRGTATVTFSDVLVGEVWFCSGQSNMEKPLGPRKGQRPTDDYDLALAAATAPALRLFQVPRTDRKQDGPAVLHWLPCAPAALRDAEFSAAAYYFGRTLHDVLGVPVGLVHSSFGGTYIDAWLPPAAFTGPLAGLDRRRYPAWVQGVQPTELYARMVAPYAPFAVRGFLWYQGETNLMAGDIATYADKQAALIAAWRRAFERPDAPFYGVLLAPMDYSRWPKFPVTDAALPAFRAAQIRALTAPHTDFIVTTDLVADLHDIHPTNKRAVGLRLARLALAETYGRTDLPAHGPEFRGLAPHGAAVAVNFDHADGLHTRDGRPPSDFEVAGADRVFHPAVALLEHGELTVSSPDVAAPAAVRFAWHETATPNLVNGAGLPAVPFRSDDWPVETARPAR